ncbi:MAG: ribosome maturation factor RimM, partial [Rhodospirillaceae bacterium]
MTDRPDPADLVLLGVVTGVRGLKGDLRIRSFTADPEGLAAYGPLWDKAAVRSYELRITGDAKGQLIGRIDGVRDRTQAEALKGLELHVPRDALPAPDDDEFYHADLLGLRAVSAAGEDLGSVSAVEDYGAGTVLEV